MSHAAASADDWTPSQTLRRRWRFWSNSVSYSWSWKAWLSRQKRSAHISHSWAQGRVAPSCANLSQLLCAALSPPNVRIWICSSVDIFEAKKFTHGDTEQKFSYGRKQVTIGGAWVGKTWIAPMGIHHKVEICCASCGRQSHEISPRGTTTYIGHVLNEYLESSNGAKYVHVETDRLFRVIISLSLRILCERHCSPVFTDLIQQTAWTKKEALNYLVGMCLCFLSFCFPSFASIPPLSQIYTLHSVATQLTTLSLSPAILLSSPLLYSGSNPFLIPTCVSTSSSDFGWNSPQRDACMRVLWGLCLHRLVDPQSWKWCLVSVGAMERIRDTHTL